MGLPRTTMGLLAFMVFVGYLLSNIFKGKYGNTYMDSVAKAELEVGNATANLNSSSGAYESITAVFTIAWNLIVMVINMILGIFTSLAIFVSTVTDLPTEISQIIISIVSIGILFSIISYVVKT